MSDIYKSRKEDGVQKKIKLKIKESTKKHRKYFSMAQAAWQNLFFLFFLKGKE